MDNQPEYQNYTQPQPVPNSTAILVLGIVSIVGCFCYGIVGIICGIIALVLAKKSKALYEANPSMYIEATYKNLKSGRICAIIGLSLSAIYILIIILSIAFLGIGFLQNPGEYMRHYQ